MAQTDMKDADALGAKLETMTIVVSEKTLFIINDQQASQTNEERFFKLGVAFPFVKALVKANFYYKTIYPDNNRFVINLLADTHETMKCLKKNLNLCGLNEIKILQPDNILPEKSLYLTEDHVKAKNAIKQGHVAVIMFPNDQEVQWCDERQLRVAFDGDAVLFSDKSDKKDGKDKVDIPLEKGPLNCFLEVLCNLQKSLNDKSPFKVLTYLVTSCNPNIGETRALKTLTSWDQEVNQAFFMAKSPKGPLLATIRPHIFFDSQKQHIDNALECGVISAQVPYGIGYYGATKEPKK